MNSLAIFILVFAPWCGDSTLLPAAAPDIVHVAISNYMYNNNIVQMSKINHASQL